MEYRRLGNTNIQVSALGFGCMRLPEYEQDGKWYIDEEKQSQCLEELMN